MCDLNQNKKQKKQKKKQKKKYCQTDVGQRAHSGVQIFYEVASLQYLCTPTFSRVFFSLSLFDLTTLGKYCVKRNK